MDEIETIELSETPIAEAVATAPAPLSTPSLTPQLAAELYVAGKSVIEIARAFSTTYSKTRKLLAINGTELRNASDRLKGRTRSSKSSSISA
jgi:hypothetical protein